MTAERRAIRDREFTALAKRAEQRVSDSLAIWQVCSLRRCGRARRCCGRALQRCFPLCHEERELLGMACYVELLDVLRERAAGAGVGSADVER